MVKTPGQLQSYVAHVSVSTAISSDRIFQMVLIAICWKDEFSMRVNKKLLPRVPHSLTTCPPDSSHFLPQLNGYIMQSM